MRSAHSDSIRSGLGYAFATVFASLMGRIVVTRFFFDYPVVIIMMQTAFTLLAIEVLRVIGVLKLAPYTFEKGKHVVLPSLLYCIAQWITVASFEGIGMPSLDSVKRFTPIFVMIAGELLRRNTQQVRVDPKKAMIVLALCVASSVAVNLEFSMDQYSFFYGLVACAFQASAFILFEGLSTNISAIELLYLHSFNSLVFFLLVDIVQDEIRDAFLYMITAAHPLFGVVFVALLISGFLFQYSVFSCIESNGSLSLQLISNVRAAVEIIVSYYLSLYFFYDVSVGFMNWLGLFATIFAASHYRNLSRDGDSVIQGPWITKA